MNGTGEMSTTIFRSKPGTTNVPFELKSSSIDYVKLLRIAPQKYPQQILNVSFRWCQPGEIQIGDICDECGVTTYSLLWNSTNCHD